MKKIIVILFCIMIVVLFKSSDTIAIPKESIRYRIIANSNSSEDQKLKWDLNNLLMPDLLNLGASSIDETRKNIQNNLSNIKSKVNSISNDNTVNYGYNYFPKKEYDGVIYNEGDYESLVITIGSGKGDNFWCVLFPPLCLVEANKNIKDYDYHFWVKDIINNS